MTDATTTDLAEAIRRGADLLRAGGLVAFPTETVYGLGGNALEERAVARIFEAKGRPRFDPLIVHFPETAAVLPYVREFPQSARILAQRFWPGPLTLVLPKQPSIPDLVTAGSDTVAVRVPDHPVALELLRQAGVPIAAPSANPFGRVSPTCAAHVRDQLGAKVDLILDGGSCRVGVESTVVWLGPEGPVLLRPGGISLELLEETLGPVVIATASASVEAGEAQMSPGTLLQHYAPLTPLTALGDINELVSARAQIVGQVGLLTLSPVPGMEQFEVVEVLSRTGDLAEAATNFFAALRRLDAAGLTMLFATDFPNVGLGRALNDRLHRAATKRT